MSTIEFEGVNLGAPPDEFLHKLIVGLRQPGVVGAGLILRDEKMQVVFYSGQVSPVAVHPVGTSASIFASRGKVSGVGEVRDPEPVNVTLSGPEDPEPASDPDTTLVLDPEP